MFIYKLLVSNYLRRLEACRAGFQACAECNPYTDLVATLNDFITTAGIVAEEENNHSGRPQPGSSR